MAETLRGNHEAKIAAYLKRNFQAIALSIPFILLTVSKVNYFRIIEAVAGGVIDQPPLSQSKTFPCN